MSRLARVSNKNDGSQLQLLPLHGPTIVELIPYSRYKTNQNKQNGDGSEHNQQRKETNAYAPLILYLVSPSHSV
jgi:hypothetical protein